MADVFESYDPVTDNESYCTAVNWRAQTFTPQTSHILEEWEVKAAKSTIDGNFVVDIYLADGAHEPTGSIIGTGFVAVSTLPVDGSGDAMAKTIITLSQQPTVLDGVEYVAVERCTGIGEVGIRAKVAGAYPRGEFLVSSDGGSIWSHIGWDQTFADRGTLLAAGKSLGFIF